MKRETFRQWFFRVVLRCKHKKTPVISKSKVDDGDFAYTATRAECVDCGFIQLLHVSYQNKAEGGESYG